MDAARAVALADRAATLNPGCARAWFMSGLLRLIGGDGERAVEDLQIAARLDPISPLNDIIRVHIGIGHFIQGKLPEALRLIRTTTHRTARIHLVLSALYGALDMPQDSRGEMALFHGRSSASVEEMIALMTSQRPELKNRFYEGLAKGLDGAPA
ncbi:MAG: tetratricopeptide repeat protein [Steroidobacteraceae bacterium]